MGIFSFGKKDEAPARGGSRSGSNGGSGRRRNESVRVERRSRRPDRSGDAEAMLLDPTLPEKQRARRRLVGAIALVIAAVIVLPMILDTHPKPVTDDIAIDIPSRPAPKTPARDADADVDTQAGVAPDNPPAADAAPAASGLASTHTTPKSAQSTQTAQATRPAAAPKQPAQAPAATTAQRQQAAPSDTDVEPGSSSRDAGTPAAPPGARYALQLGSFADDASARKWEAKLKAAGVPVYTEHGKTADGKTRTLLRAGPFPDRAAASAAIAKVRGAGFATGSNSGGAE
ncbi:MAG TPA: SPOR domain-containing protein [Paraburkholderia sp.]|jgi:DedD protein